MDPVMKLIEECAELQKALCKAERFGWENCPPKHPGRTNLMHIVEELSDVKDAMYDLIDSRPDLQKEFYGFQ
jgi:hypothetical protein